MLEIESRMKSMLPELVSVEKSGDGKTGFQLEVLLKAQSAGCSEGDLMRSCDGYGWLRQI